MFFVPGFYFEVQARMCSFVCKWWSDFMAEGFVAFMELGKPLLKQDRCKQSCSKLDLAGCIYFAVDPQNLFYRNHGTPWISSWKLDAKLWCTFETDSGNLQYLQKRNFWDWSLWLLLHFAMCCCKSLCLCIWRFTYTWFVELHVCLNSLPPTLFLRPLLYCQIQTQIRVYILESFKNWWRICESNRKTSIVEKFAAQRRYNA
jgi:hypothetical protein